MKNENCLHCKEKDVYYLNKHHGYFCNEVCEYSYFLDKADKAEEE